MKVIRFGLPLREDAMSVKGKAAGRLYDLPHAHKEMQISLVLEGEGLLTVGNYSQVFQQGDIYIINANQSHLFEWNQPAARDNATGDQAVHIYFDSKRIPETFFLLQELTSVRKFISFCKTGLQLPGAYRAQVAAMILSLNNKKNLSQLLGLFELLHFFSTEVSGWQSMSGSFDHYIVSVPGEKRMDDVFKYTLDNYADNITLNKIASVAHITPHAFCKYFKLHTSKTYNNFLNEVRVNEACKKIISGNYDGLSAIAYKTGFKGASNFNRVFKKATGMSPSDYRKEFRFKTA